MPLKWARRKPNISQVQTDFPKNLSKLASNWHSNMFGNARGSSQTGNELPIWYYHLDRRTAISLLLCLQLAQETTPPWIFIRAGMGRYFCNMSQHSTSGKRVSGACDLQHQCSTPWREDVLARDPWWFAETGLCLCPQAASGTTHWNLFGLARSGVS